MSNNKILTKYNLVLFDFHGVFTSNVGRTTHALVKAADNVHVTDKNAIRELLVGLLSRPKEIPARTFIRENAPHGKGVGMQEAYRVYEETEYVPQYSWVLSKIVNQGKTVAIISNGKMDSILECVEKWHWNVNGIYARGHHGNLDTVAKKPSGDPINIALLDLASRGFWDGDRSRALYVGDYLHDITAAQEAGIDSALVVSGMRQLNELAIKPTMFLFADHLRNCRVPSELDHIPTFLMRDLPEISGSKYVSRERFKMAGLERY